MTAGAIAPAERLSGHVAGLLTGATVRPSTHGLTIIMPVRESRREAEHEPANRSATSPWLTASEAAEYLRCPLSRIRKLTMTRDLPCEHDGRRVLYNRDDLDAYIRAGGSKSP